MIHPLLWTEYTLYFALQWLIIATVWGIDIQVGIHLQPKNICLVQVSWSLLFPRFYCLTVIYSSSLAECHTIHTPYLYICGIMVVLLLFCFDLQVSDICRRMQWPFWKQLNPHHPSSSLPSLLETWITSKIDDTL